MTYFISYQFTTRQGSGVGNIDVERDHPITTIQHVRGLEAQLRDHTGSKTVIILHWILMNETP